MNGGEMSQEWIADAADTAAAACRKAGLPVAAVPIVLHAALAHMDFGPYKNGYADGREDALRAIRNAIYNPAEYVGARLHGERMHDWRLRAVIALLGTT